MKKLSESQLAALHTAAGQKLSRSSLGWGFEDSEGRWQIFRPATIESLRKRGLLDSNWVVEGLVTDDGAVHDCGTPKLQVWANAHGNEVLRLALADELKDMRLH